MKPTARALIALTCVLLVTLSVGSMAQTPRIADDPGVAASRPGAAILPFFLPHIPATAEEVSRGYQYDIHALKAQLSAAGSFPGMSEDAAVTGGAPPELTASVGAPTLTTNFEGIPATGSFPPDPIIAAGPNHVIQAVNRSFRISTHTGATISTTTFASWWSTVITGVGPFDPKVVYDQHSNRWVLLTVARNTSTSESWYLISTSWTSDPTGMWCVWALDADVDGTTPSGNWADYPQLGLDDQAFYITSNQFSFSSNSFQYSKLRVLPKAQFYNNTCGPITSSDLVNMQNADGSPVFTLQPVLTFGTPGKEYLINASSAFGSDVTLWSVTNPTATPPTLTREATVPVASFVLPPDAEQMGSFTRIDSGDARLMNAVFRNGSLYTAHAVTCSGTFACARYLRIDVAGPTVTLDETFGALGLYYFYPVIMPDPSGNIVTVFNRSGASEFAGIRYTGRRAADSAFQPSALLKAGETSYVQLDGLGRNRWGDYNGIALDPSDTTQVWIYSEFARTPASTWGTWVGRVDATTGTPGPEPGPCPATTMVQGTPDRPATLVTLYSLRAKMAQSPEGRRYIRLYYQHALEGSLLLLQNPELRAEALNVVAWLRPTIEAVNGGQHAALTAGDLAAIERLMDAFAAKGGAPLRRAIEQVRSDLRSGKLLSSFAVDAGASR